MTELRIETDFLVIGAGFAGLTFALRAAEHGKVTVLMKQGPFDNNTAQAQGGIASVYSPEDSFESHIHDTLVAGDGLCNPKVVEQVVKNAPARIKELLSLGVRFTKWEGSANHEEYDLAREGGHSKRRIFHTKDQTGWEIQRALFEAASTHPNIEMRANTMAVDLITSTRYSHFDINRCLGAYVLDKATGDVQTVFAKTTFLAAGGAGKVYLYTSNPDGASGDGIAIAARAGARVANMEFFQFHPTCLFHPAAKSFLISEAVRGEGGILRNSKGEAFMEHFHPRKELAPRDVVARAIDATMKTSGEECVFLDVTHLDPNFLKDRFPHIYQTCLSHGIDITTQPIPVVPAAHYLCGGVMVNLQGETTIRNLFAGGEVACSGLHGANRLASNSLLECAVYGHTAAETAISRLKETPNVEFPIPDWDPGTTVDSNEGVIVAQNWAEIRHLMWNYVGIVRSDRRLARALRRIAVIQQEIREYYWQVRVTPDLLELRNLALVAELIIKSAQARKESRGLHFTLDYPEKDNRWLRDTVL
jgi:L-aspartate oxidase